MNSNDLQKIVEGALRVGFSAQSIGNTDNGIVITDRQVAAVLAAVLIQKAIEGCSPDEVRKALVDER